MRKLVTVSDVIRSETSLAPAFAAVKASEELRKSRLARSRAARSTWERTHKIEPAGKDDSRTAAERADLQKWFATELGPRLAGLRTIDVARALDISRVYARGIVRGEKIPHPRHFQTLAKLIGGAQLPPL